MLNIGLFSSTIIAHKKKENNSIRQGNKNLMFIIGNKRCVFEEAKIMEKQPAQRKGKAIIYIYANGLIVLKNKKNFYF